MRRVKLGERGRRVERRGGGESYTFSHNLLHLLSSKGLTISKVLTLLCHRASAGTAGQVSPGSQGKARMRRR